MGEAVAIVWGGGGNCVGEAVTIVVAVTFFRKVSSPFFIPVTRQY